MCLSTDVFFFLNKKGILAKDLLSRTNALDNDFWPEELAVIRQGAHRGFYLEIYCVSLDIFISNIEFNFKN